MPNIIQSNVSRKQFSRRKSFDLYKKVIELRKREYSYTEIKKETGLAKSTIQNWLTYAGLTITKEHLEIQSRKRIENYYSTGVLASSIVRAKNKELRIQLFIQKVKKYFSDPFFVAGVMLYEAEGSKGENNCFSNSDFRLILTYVKFIEKYFSLDRNINMSFRLYIHETRKEDLERIKNFWAKKISIKPEILRISWKHNIVTNRRFNPDYEGQLNVRVNGVRNFTSKMLAVSDIILTRYRRT